MFCELSFIVITNNPDYKNYAKNVVESIHNVCTPSEYTYEILVCSPHEIQDSSVIYVEDEKGADGSSVRAYNQAYKESKGRYIFILNDDHMIGKSALNAIEFLKSERFKERKYKVTSIGAGAGCNKWVSTCVPSLAFLPPFPLSEELSHPRFATTDRYLIMGYPVFDRETVEKHFGGYLLNPKFKHHYADNWLPFWLGENGEEPLICDNTPLYPFGSPSSNCKNDLEDYTTFTMLVKDLLLGKNKNYA